MRSKQYTFSRSPDPDPSLKWVAVWDWSGHHDSSSSGRCPGPYGVLEMENVTLKLMILKG